MALFLLLVGLAMLVGGAELLVRGGGQMALSLRVPPLIVGLTVVAFGTSAPELAVSVSAAWTGSTEAALANVTGSNIANILLVLGLASLVRPLVVDRGLIKREIPALLLFQLLVPLLFLDEVLGFVDGLVLVGFGVGYNLLLIRQALSDRDAALSADAEPGEPVRAGPLILQGVMLLAGIAVLVAGAQLFVGSAFTLATWFGMSERFIGLTVIALGTSAPEIVTGAVSAYRGETELAFGNSIGSNILNISMVLSITALLHPIAFHDTAAWLDLIVANAVTLLLVPLVMLTSRIGRLTGFVMVATYVAYILLNQG